MYGHLAIKDPCDAWALELADPGARVRPSVLVITLLWACSGSAQTTADKPMVFRLAQQQLESSSIQVAGGITVVAADWAALVFMPIGRTTILGKKATTCSGVLLGPNALLTAAHCVDTFDGQAIVEPKLAVGVREMPLECTIFPDYLKLPEKIRVPRGSQDYALCLVADGGRPPEALQQLTFEVIDKEVPLATGDKVLVTGYGCTAITVVDGDLEAIKGLRTLNIGDSVIERSAGRVPAQPMYVTTRSAEAKEVSLCPGDSGGPLFSGVTQDQPDGTRRVRAVNSMIDLDVRLVEAPAPGGVGKVTVKAYDVISSMSSVASPEFRKWATAWAEDNKVRACGINAAPGTGQCRK